MITVQIDNAALLARLQGYPERLVRSMVATMQRLTIRLQINVKRDKLSGQVLHVRTGTLRRSINQRVRSAGGGQIEGIVGTNVEYGRTHEYGFKGTASVRQHIRQIKKSGREAMVRSHPRNVNLPERSFLRSALREMQPTINAELQRAATKAL